MKFSDYLVYVPNEGSLWDVQKVYRSDEHDPNAKMLVQGDHSTFNVGEYGYIGHSMDRDKFFNGEYIIFIKSKKDIDNLIKCIKTKDNMTKTIIDFINKYE